MPFSDKYKVVFPDGTFTYLNPALVKSKKVSNKNIDLLKHAHIYKWNLFKDMEASIDDPEELQALAQKVEDLEFYMQELWGFPKNSDYHRWWEVPGCNCGALDAEDNYGTPYRMYSTECPIHSWKQYNNH